MASASDSRSLFRKLKIDTQARPKPPRSTFSTISQNDRSNHIVPEPGRDGASAATDDLPHGKPNPEHNGDEANPHKHSRQQSVPDLGGSFRKRQTSISFDPNVRLDSGISHSLDEPLPKPTFSNGRRSPIPVNHGPAVVPYHERGFSASQTDLFDRSTGAPLDDRTVDKQQYRSGEERHPLLQQTVDELSRDPAVGYSTPIASPLATSIRSAPGPPRTPYEGSEYLLSPLQTSSPSEAPSSPWPMLPGSGSTRSREYRSGRSSISSSVHKSSRPSRRSTGRSATSSMSPASAFLGSLRLPRDDTVCTSPDDEGQEIGDHSEYIIGKKIGFGGFSVVKEVFTIDKATGERIRRAVKIVRKELEGKSEFQNEELQSQFEHQISIWRYLNHPHILRLLAVYETPFATFCITDLNVGGTLFDLIRKERRAGREGVSIDHAKRYAYQLASALHYLHVDMHIVHRDVKLENCLLDMSAPGAQETGGNVLLCDFGMADFITNDSRDSPEPLGTRPFAAGLAGNVGPSSTSTTITGSLPYAAPELFAVPYPLYSPAVDLWAYGVIVHALLRGHLPFHHDFQAMLRALIEKGAWDVDGLRAAVLAKGATDDDADAAVQLVQGCLARDPYERYAIEDVLASPWLAGCEEKYGCRDEDG